MLRRLTTALLTLLLLLISLTAPRLTAAQSTGVLTLQDLEADLDFFLDNGAEGFLVWDEEGTFFMGSPICETLQQKSQEIADNQYVGINSFLLADLPPDTIGAALSHLKNNCGAKVVRIWGNNPGSSPLSLDVLKLNTVLNIASTNGIQLIIVLGDYSNGSRGMAPGYLDILPSSIHSDPTAWYAGGYIGYGYLNHVIEVVGATKNHPGLYGYELANEAHCEGITSCVNAYNTWVSSVSGNIKSMTGNRVGIGQMASNPNSIADNPNPGGNFVLSNSYSSIDMASGHFYTPAQRDQVKRAFAVSPKPFYVGEAGYLKSAGDCLTKRQPHDFHSLRPNPACPLDGTVSETNFFLCGNDLITEKRFTLDRTELPPGVTEIGCREEGGLLVCDYAFDLAIPIDVNLENLELPIMGLTEGPYVINSTLEDRSFDAPGRLTPAQKMNEYVSWYLNGTLFRAEENRPVYYEEYPAKPEGMEESEFRTLLEKASEIINYSGPLNKLLPLRIHHDVREQQIENANTIRYNQTAGCHYNLENADLLFGLISIPSDILNFLNSLGPIDYLIPDESLEGKDITDQVIGPCYPDVDKDNNGTITSDELSALKLDPGPLPDWLIPDLKVVIEKEDLTNWTGGDNRMPPHPDDPAYTDNPSQYLLDYQRWRGKFCLNLGLFYVCYDEPGSDILRPNYWADLFPYIPMSSTEDRVGYAMGDLTMTDQPVSDANITSILFDPADPDGADDYLFFPHMQESAELGDLLQSTYRPFSQPAFGNLETQGIYPTQRCELIDSRTNPGDKLHESRFDIANPDDDQNPISGDIVLSGTFTASFPRPTCEAGGVPVYPGEEHCNTSVCMSFICQADGTWAPTDARGVCDSHPACGGTGDPVVYPPPPQTVNITLRAALSIYTAVPKVEEVWQRFVIGAMSAFKRIYPQVGPGAPVEEIEDIPARSLTYAQYTGGDNTLAGDPALGRPGSEANIFYPHIGSIYDYFLKGIQKALRPKDLSTFNPSIGQPPPEAAEINCIQTVTDAAFPDVFKKTSEFYANNRCANPPGVPAGDFKAGAVGLAKAWSARRGYTFVQECYNDVISRSLAKGYNPAFSILLWIEESDASNYTDPSNPGWWDFGIRGSTPSRDFNAQIEAFLSRYDRYQELYPKCFDGSNGLTDMESFLFIFQLGYNGLTGKSYAEDSSCTPKPDLNTGWVDGIKNYWNILMNWSCLACPFPQSPTDNTCP